MSVIKTYLPSFALLRQPKGVTSTYWAAYTWSGEHVQCLAILDDGKECGHQMKYKGGAHSGVRVAID
jgi:hypothetical protein